MCRWSIKYNPTSDVIIEYLIQNEFYTFAITCNILVFPEKITSTNSVGLFINAI